MNNKQTANALTREFYENRIAEAEADISERNANIHEKGIVLEAAMAAVTYKNQRKAVKDAVAAYLTAIEERGAAREGLIYRRHDRERFLASALGEG